MYSGEVFSHPGVQTHPARLGRVALPVLRDEEDEMTDRETFRKAVEARDLDDMLAPFAEDAVLHSPITFKPFEGRAAIRELLGILLEVFQDFRYTDELES